MSKEKGTNIENFHCSTKGSSETSTDGIHLKTVLVWTFVPRLPRPLWLFPSPLHAGPSLPSGWSCAMTRSIVFPTIAISTDPVRFPITSYEGTIGKTPCIQLPTRFGMEKTGLYPGPPVSFEGPFLRVHDRLPSTRWLGTVSFSPTPTPWLFLTISGGKRDDLRGVIQMK